MARESVRYWREKQFPKVYLQEKRAKKKKSLDELGFF